jgi:hypothetical protein
MASRLRSDRELDRTASKTTTRYFFVAIGTAALIGLLIGIVWTIAGLLHFHPLW